MLILSRREKDRIVFPGLGISVEVIRVKPSRVSIGIDAPEGVRVVRHELLDQSCEGVDDVQAASATEDAGPPQASQLESTRACPSERSTRELPADLAAVIEQQVRDRIGDELDAVIAKLSSARLDLDGIRQADALESLNEAVAELRTLRGTATAAENASIKFDEQECAGAWRVNETVAESRAGYSHGGYSITRDAYAPACGQEGGLEQLASGTGETIVLSVRADEQVGEPTVRLLQQYGRTVSDERFGRVSSGEVLLQIG